MGENIYIFEISKGGNTFVGVYRIYTRRIEVVVFGFWKTSIFRCVFIWLDKRK